jgi:putative phosphoesterase
MRVAAVSDIHGNLFALNAVISDIKRRRIDTVVNLGDSLSGPLLPRETAQLLMKSDWIQLAGNHERQLIELGPTSSDVDRFAHAQLGVKELAWIESLSHTGVIEPDVLLCHGTPRNDTTCLLQDGDRPASAVSIDEHLTGIGFGLILCGHSHVPRFVRSQGRLVVNPGSVGHPAFADEFPYPHVIENGSPDARYAIVEFQDGYWQVDLVAVPYENLAAADLAMENGFADWAQALRTGYVS